MNIKKLKILGAMALFFVMALSGLAAEQKSPQNLTVSLITCYPGEEIYELCGHSAVRVRGEGIDSVWNYGIFDFNQPNFVYRFVKGETDYRGASYPFKWFMPEYVATGRRVVEQDINFTPEEAQKMLEILRKSVLPENAVYRYNYIKDNCSTRILNHVDSASEVKIIYPDSVRYGTFRNEMRAYHENYPWYQFGIDVALGSGLDQQIDSREEMFVPMELMRNASTAKFADGRPFIKDTRILNVGKQDAILAATTWWLSPLFWAWILALFLIGIAAYNIIAGYLTSGIYVAWFFMLGLAGCLVTFLVFISVHESTSPNLLIFWLNPFQFIFIGGILIKKLRVLAFVMSVYNMISGICLLVLYPFFLQSFNSAFFPLILATISLSCAYAILSIKKSYKRV